jgi:hypothetical protein
MDAGVRLDGKCPKADPIIERVRTMPHRSKNRFTITSDLNAKRFDAGAACRERKSVVIPRQARMDARIVWFLIGVSN